MIERDTMVKVAPIPWAKVRAAPIAELRKYLHKDRKPRPPAKVKPLVIPRIIRRPLSSG